MAADRQKILLVEDDDGDVRLVRHALDEAKAAYELSVVPTVAAARDFIKAVEAGKQPNPDVALLDINLPDGDGIEVLRRIRSSPEMRHLACYMFTTSNQPLDVADAKDSGATRYIVKPMDPSATVSLVSEIHRMWLTKKMMAP